MAMKIDKLAHTERSLGKLWEFLKDYLPLANAHTTDFITSSQWESCVPPPITTQLLALNSEELAQLPSGELFTPCCLQNEENNCNLIKRHPCSVGSAEVPCVNICNTVSSQHCGHGHDGTVTSNKNPGDGGVLQMSGLASPEMTCGPGIQIKQGKRRKLPRDQIPRWLHGDLKSFVCDVRKHCLPELGVTTDLDNLISGWKGEHASTGEKLVIHNIMAIKKSHEVEVMADVCATLAEHYKINQLIDIGSGKGYLSSHLALMHHLPVLGIDSSQTNTGGATVRTQRLAKHWNGLVRNAQEERQLGVRMKRGKNYRGKQRKKEAKSKQLSPADEPIALITGEPLVYEDLGLADVAAVFDPTDLNNLGQERKQINEESFKVETDKGGENNTQEDPSFAAGSASLNESVDDPNLKLKQTNSDEGNLQKNNCSNLGKNVNQFCEHNSTLYVPVTHFVTRDTNLQELVAIHMSQMCTHPTDIGETKYASRTQVLHPFHIRETHSGHAAVVHPDALCPNMLLTGLHTCGNLAPSMLHLFVSNKCVQAVCNVGCCYNHLDEEFVQGPFEPDDASFTDFGFPISSYLKSCRCWLGRNARMLAAQSPDRMAKDKNLSQINVPVSQRSLFWRALLQILLKDVTGENRDDWHVGKIAAKCNNFTQYVHKALGKLGISHQLSDDDIKQYEDTHSLQEAKIAAFFQLRATLGPCIEALILLDRLAFLLEQDCVDDAHLVQMFDSVKSPRCYGLVAIKK